MLATHSAHLWLQTLRAAFEGGQRVNFIQLLLSLGGISQEETPFGKIAWNQKRVFPNCDTPGSAKGIT